MPEKELFEGLPEQRVPERPRGAPRLLTAARDQVALRAVDLEGLIAADDAVRDVWTFVAGLNLAPLYEAIEAREGTPGHPAIDPKILVALWLYATIRGVGSARAVERLCASDVAFQWLCGGVHVNYHTLSDFRVAHGALLDRLLTQSVAVLIAEGLVDLDRLALDGLRVRASAGAASFRRRRSLNECHAAARDLVQRLRHELEDDPAVGERRRQAAVKRAAAERLARVEAARRRLTALENERRRRAGRHKGEVEKKTEPRASTTDPEARVMKMADGGWRPAYNGEFVSDPASLVIVGVAVDKSGSDHGWIKPMLRQVRQRYRRTPREFLVDAGFSRAEDIEWAARPRNGATAVFMAPIKTKHRTDPYAPRRRDGPGVAAWRARMASKSGQAIYKLRSVHECINAQLRQRGLAQLTVRGKAKAQLVFLWHALAHNMMRTFSLRREREARLAASG
jgi:transposase